MWSFLYDGCGEERCELSLRDFALAMDKAERGSGDSAGIGAESLRTGCGQQPESSRVSERWWHLGCLRWCSPLVYNVGVGAVDYVVAGRLDFLD